jgi:hypothetical protein
MRTHFYPQQWLLCHMGLYSLEFEFDLKAPAAREKSASKARIQAGFSISFPMVEARERPNPIPV